MVPMRSERVQHSLNDLLELGEQKNRPTDIFSSVPSKPRRDALLYGHRHRMYVDYLSRPSHPSSSCNDISHLHNHTLIRKRHTDGSVFETAAYRTKVLHFATSEYLTPAWLQIFLRAIGANQLVCFAIFMSICPRKRLRVRFSLSAKYTTQTHKRTTVSEKRAPCDTHTRDAF